MIKSAFIFGAGFIVGSAYTASRVEAVERAAYAFIHFLNDEALKDDVERKKQADAKADAEGAPGRTAPQQPQDDLPPEPDEADVVDDTTHDAAPQGETTS